jgi:hypothetical protein
MRMLPTACKALQLLLTGALGTVAVAQAGSWNGTLRIRVLDEYGRPITTAGAVTGLESEVTTQQALVTPQSKSDGSGYLCLPVAHDSYRSWTRSSAVIASQGHVGLRIGLPGQPGGSALDAGTHWLPLSATLRGRVRDSVGRPLPGVRVEASALGGIRISPLGTSIELFAGTVSDTQGFFSLECATKGPTTITFTKAGYFATALDSFGPNSPLSATLESSGYVSGTVVGFPMENVDLQVAYEGSVAASLPPQCYADGRFRIPVTGRGRLRVIVRNPTGQIVGTSHLLSGPCDDVAIAIKTRTIVVQASIGSQLAGSFRVEPIWGTPDSIHLTFPRRDGVHSTTGRVELDIPLLFPPTHLLITAPGFSTVQAITDDRDQQCALTPAAVVQGLVLDAAGQSVPKAKIVAMCVPSSGMGCFGPCASEGRSAADGSYRLELPAGTYVVQIEHPDYCVPKGTTCAVAAGQSLRMPLVRLARWMSLRGQLVGDRRTAAFINSSSSYVIGDTWSYLPENLPLPGLVDIDTGSFFLTRLSAQRQSLVLCYPPTSLGMWGSEIPLGDYDVGSSPVIPVEKLPGKLGGKVEVKLPMEARSRFLVVATRLSKAVSSQAAQVAVAPVVEGRYDLLLPPGDYGIAVDDGIIGMCLFEHGTLVHIPACGNCTLDLAFALHKVDVDFVAQDQKKPCLANVLLEAEDESKMAKGPYGGGITIYEPTASLTVLLPDGEYRLVAYDNSEALRTDGKPSGSHELGSVKFLVKEPMKVSLKLEPGRTSDQLR